MTSTAHAWSTELTSNCVYSMLRIVQHLIGQAGSPPRSPRLHHHDAMRRAGAPPRYHASREPRRCAAARTRVRIRSSNRAWTETSSPPVGSSMNTRLGCVTSVRAICNRCSMPPEKVRGRSSILDRRRSLPVSASRCRLGVSDIGRSCVRTLRHQPLAHIAAGRDGHAQILPRVLMHECPIPSGAARATPAPASREHRQRTASEPRYHTAAGIGTPCGQTAR